MSAIDSKYMCGNIVIEKKKIYAMNPDGLSSVCFVARVPSILEYIVVHCLDTWEAGQITIGDEYNVNRYAIDANIPKNEISSPVIIPFGSVYMDVGEKVIVYIDYLSDSGGIMEITTVSLNLRGE